jgi:hypothetical protein
VKQGLAVLADNAAAGLDEGDVIDRAFLEGVLRARSGRS